MRYLGLDLGTKTLGISISDKTGIIATSLTTIRHDDDFNYLTKELKKIIEEREVDVLVLGLPKNMNGTIGERGETTIKFKEKLEKELNKKVILEDERLTTRIAENILIKSDISRKKRKKVIDKMSATVILQSYLDKVKREWLYMNKLTILVATEDEKKSLIPEEYKDNVLITGIGVSKVIESLKDTKLTGTIINIGYAGASNDINVGTICSITSSYCYRTIYKNTDLININYIKDENIINTTCATSIDFIENNTLKNTLFDMELRAIVSFYKNTYSLKIVSDNGSMNDYDNALNKDYKKILKEIQRIFILTINTKS